LSDDHIKIKFKVVNTPEEARKDYPGYVKIYGKQAEFLKLDNFLTAFVGGVGGGKTFAGCCKAVMYAVKYPKAFGFIGANTIGQLNGTTLPVLYDVLTKAGLQKDIDWVFGKAPLKAWGVKTRFLQDHKGILTLRNGAQVRTWSMHEWRNLDGMSLQWAYIDESWGCDPEGVEVIVSRIRGVEKIYPPSVFTGRAFFTTFPNGHDHTYQMFAGENKHPDAAFVHAKSGMNPFLEATYTSNLKAFMDADRAQTKIDACWDEFKIGRVFNFDKRNHVIGV